MQLDWQTKQQQSTNNQSFFSMQSYHLCEGLSPLHQLQPTSVTQWDYHTKKQQKTKKPQQNKTTTTTKPTQGKGSLMHSRSLLYKAELWKVNVNHIFNFTSPFLSENMRLSQSVWRLQVWENNKQNKTNNSKQAVTLKCVEEETKMDD